MNVQDLFGTAATVQKIHFGVLIGWCRAETPAGPVQMATLRTRDYSLRGALVFAGWLARALQVAGGEQEESWGILHPESRQSRVKNLWFWQRIAGSDVPACNW
jgi:hypothetical protein